MVRSVKFTWLAVYSLFCLLVFMYSYIGNFIRVLYLHFFFSKIWKTEVR
jgi:hypothetical protein